MRSLFLVALLFCTAHLPAVVPLEGLSWSSDSCAPSAAGMAARVQVYMIVDFSEQSGRDLYGGLQWNARSKYARNYGMMMIFIASGGDVPQKGEKDADEWWVKAADQTGGLVRAFVGDALAAIVTVDGSGKVASISRLGDIAPHWKGIEALFPTAHPLVDNEGLFPLSAKKALRWLKLGDTKNALKETKKMGPDGPTMSKLLAEQANHLVESDAKTISDGATSASARMFAVQRVGRVMEEFPGCPAASAATAAIKQIKGDKPMANEQAAWDMLQEYLRVARKTPVKKIKELQLGWLTGITSKFGGTHAAEVATMIRAASRVDE